VRCDSTPSPGSPLTFPRLTKARELGLGRLAMFGFSASFLGELITGKGALAQFDIETGLPLNESEPLILAFVGLNAVLALWPASGKFVAEQTRKKPWYEEEAEAREAAKRTGPLVAEDFWDLFAHVLGLTKERELIVGRLAQLGFASSIVGELMTGLGPLGQLRMEESLPMTQLEPLLAVVAIFIVLASLSPGTGDFEDDAPAANNPK